MWNDGWISEALCAPNKCNLKRVDNRNGHRTININDIFHKHFEIIVLFCACTSLNLKSIGPIDRNFHGHGENDGIVLNEFIIKKKCSRFCKYTNINIIKKRRNNMSTIKRKHVRFMELHLFSYVIVSIVPSHKHIS